MYTNLTTSDNNEKYIEQYSLAYYINL